MLFTSKCAAASYAESWLQRYLVAILKPGGNNRRQKAKIASYCLVDEPPLSPGVGGGIYSGGSMSIAASADKHVRSFSGVIKREIISTQRS